MLRFFGVAACGLVLVAVALVACSSTALAKPVRVRGGAKLLAQARFVTLRNGRALELRGQLRDDREVPIVAAWVALRVPAGLDLGEATSCPQVGGQLKEHDGQLSLRAGARGELCVRWPAAPSSGKFTLRFEGDEFHGSDSLPLRFDGNLPQRLRTTLRFDPRPTTLDLNKERILLSGELLLAADNAYAQLHGLSVTLLDEHDKPLAAAKVAGDGKVRVEVLPKALGRPGIGAIKLQFAGNKKLEPALVEHTITRRATVTLKLLEALEPVHAGDDLRLVLRVKTLRGHVEGGVVEILADGQSAGTANVHDGRVELAIPISNRAEGSVSLAARFLPASPWYRSGRPFVLEVPIAPPNPLWRGLLLAIVVLAAAWVVFSWRRVKTLPKLSRAHPLLAPGVHVIASRRGDTRYNGLVLDAHDGSPIAGATIMVRAPSLDDTGVVISTTSDGFGAFAFELHERPDAAEIVAEAPLHSRQQRALPIAGKLRIALMTRRRAIVQRLVQWARVRGRPYDQQPDPTPAHVRKQAGGRAAVEGWAAGVEQAAYGPAAVDAHVEHTLRAAEPGPEEA